jgi:hypothetical protein
VTSIACARCNASVVDVLTGAPAFDIPRTPVEVHYHDGFLHVGGIGTIEVLNGRVPMGPIPAGVPLALVHGYAREPATGSDGAPPTPDTVDETRICDHCSQPIASGHMYVTVRVPEGEVPVHVDCISKQTKSGSSKASCSPPDAPTPTPTAGSGQLRLIGVVDQVPNPDSTMESSDPSMGGPLQRAAVELAIAIILRHGQLGLPSHKSWVIDQVLRLLAADRYDELRSQACDGDEGPDTYDWDEGIPP